MLQPYQWEQTGLIRSIVDKHEAKKTIEWICSPGQRSLPLAVVSNKASPLDAQTSIGAFTVGDFSY